MPKLDRRQFLITAGSAAAAALVAHGCQSKNESPTGAEGTGSQPQVNINPGDAPEVTGIKLGYIPVTSGAALVIAKAKGHFDKYGMTDVELIKQSSWGTFRDNIVLGSAGGGVEGGHLLFAIIYGIHTGELTNNQPLPMHLVARLNLNGQGVTVGNAYQDLKIGLDSSPLKPLFEKAKAEGKDPKCAVPFPRVTGDFFMRWWLAAGGIIPDKDIPLIVVPPAQAVANMKVGNMEAFSLVEPWHQLAITQGVGYTAVTSGELWNDHPEKALGIRADWVDKHPKATKAILMALMEAQMWCDQMENKDEMCQILSQPEWYKVAKDILLPRAMGTFDYGLGRVVENSPHLVKYWQNNASYPFKSHDLWGLVEDMRWGFRAPDTAMDDLRKIVDAVNREDLWKEAAKAIGQEAMIPQSTSRGVETFFDGRSFDPEKPEDYLKAA